MRWYQARGSLFLVAIGSAMLSSCGSLGLNAQRSLEQRPQASHPLTSGRQLIGTVFRSTAVASIRQPVTTTKVGLALAYQRVRTTLRSSVSLVSFVSPPGPEIPGTREFEHLLDEEGIGHSEPGTVRFLVDGPAFFSSFYKDVEAAKKTIDIQIFIFDNDDTAVRCADALRARSNETRVRVLFDDLGTTFAQATPPETLSPVGFSPPSDIRDYLKKGSKVRVRRTLNPWLVADHTKLLVFDGKAAYLGGMNLGREYESEWHDLMVRVEGPIVVPLQLEFSRAWRKAGPAGDLALFRKPSVYESVPSHTGPTFRILRTDAAVGRYDILKATKLAISSARKRVWIENPYFAADDIEDAVIAAARRGVDVRVILPSRGDSTIMDIGNLATARNLIRNGVKVMRYDRMTHMKVMICDDWATFGSANLDTLSMRINRELNLATRDPESIERLEKKIFLPDFRDSEPMTLEDTSNLMAPIAESIADHL